MQGLIALWACAVLFQGKSAGDDAPLEFKVAIARHLYPPATRLTANITVVNRSSKGVYVYQPTWLATIDLDYTKAPSDTRTVADPDYRERYVAFLAPGATQSFHVDLDQADKVYAEAAKHPVRIRILYDSSGALHTAKEFGWSRIPVLLRRKLPGWLELSKDGAAYRLSILPVAARSYFFLSTRSCCGECQAIQP
jgi:hypothetical protein